MSHLPCDALWRRPSWPQIRANSWPLEDREALDEGRRFSWPTLSIREWNHGLRLTVSWAEHSECVNERKDLARERGELRMMAALWKRTTILDKAIVDTIVSFLEEEWKHSWNSLSFRRRHHYLAMKVYAGLREWEEE